VKKKKEDYLEDNFW